MSRLLVWYVQLKGSIDTTCALSALRAGGVLARPVPDDDQSVGGIVFAAGPSPELVATLRSANSTGAERIVVALPHAGLLRNEDRWALLRAGASDVCAWSGEPGVGCNAIVQRFQRWSRVDAIVRSPQVRELAVGASCAWQAALRRVVETALFTNAPVLIEGETGTGKDCIARLIHDLDPRERKGALAVLDCTTVVPELSGSEFFGHERGAFTGAVSARDGAFALADGGTLFLDEIGELPRTLQAELLRVVQEGTYKRVGGNNWRPSRFRLVSATNRNLLAEVQGGGFRQDLYYRIASVRIILPPLRQRPDDVLPLARHFLQQLHPDRDPPPLDEAVTELLLRRSYPGNVRDLRQLVTRIALRHPGDGPVTPGDVPEEDRPPADAVDGWPDADFEIGIARAVALNIPLKEIGRATTAAAIRSALTQEGTLQGAARRLGVTDRALQMRRQKERQMSVSEIAMDATPPRIADLPPS